MINATRSAYIKVPRELALLLKDNVGAQRAFSAFLEAITAKVDGSNSSLSDLEQRSGGTAKARVFEAGKDIEGMRATARPSHSKNETDKAIEGLRASLRSAKARIHEINKELENLKMEARIRTNVAEFAKRLDEIDATARPRG